MKEYYGGRGEVVSEGDGVQTRRGVLHKPEDLRRYGKNGGYETCTTKTRTLRKGKEEVDRLRVRGRFAVEPVAEEDGQGVRSGPWEAGVGGPIVSRRPATGGRGRPSPE